MERTKTQTDVMAARALTGRTFVGREPSLISPVLGSWVAACPWDPPKGFGDMGQFLYPVTKFKGDATAGRDKGFLCCPPDAVLEHGLSKRAAGPARRRRKPLMCAYRPGDVIGTRGALTEHGRRIIPEDIGGAIRRGIVYDRPAGETVIRKGQTRRRGDGYPHGQGDRQP